MIYRSYDDDYDPGLLELIAEDRAERRRRVALMDHPDCRDPDHPGCECCAEEEA